MALRDLDSTYPASALTTATRKPCSIRCWRWPSRACRAVGAQQRRAETVIMEAAAVGMSGPRVRREPHLGALVEGDLINLYGVTRDEAPATGTVRLTLTGSTTTTIDEAHCSGIEDADSMLVATETVRRHRVDGRRGCCHHRHRWLPECAITAAPPATLSSPCRTWRTALHTDLNGGADAEDDLAFLTRAATARPGHPSLVVPEHFTAYALSSPT